MNLPINSDPADQEFLVLLEKARAGDTDALGALIHRYRPYLLKIAYEEGDTSLQAKEADSDVVQDTCLQALSVFGQFRGESSQAMRAWLRQILMRQLGDVRDHFHAQKRDVRAEIPLQPFDAADSRNDHLAAPNPTPSEHLMRREEIDSLERAVRELSELDRTIIEMRQKDGRAFAEIARQLHLSEAATQKRWARAVQTLKEKVARPHDHSTR